MDANADILLSLSYCFSSLFVFLLFLAIIVQVVREVSSYSILKAIYFKKTLLQNEIFRDNALFFANILLQIHTQRSIPDICQFWKKYTTASNGGSSPSLCYISLFYMRSPPRGLYFFSSKNRFFSKTQYSGFEFFLRMQL